MYAELAATRASMCSQGQLFEIEEVEVAGVRIKAWKHAANSLRKVWLQAAGHSESDYLVYQDERWTYSQAQDEVSRIANYLRSSGIQPHDRVAIAMRNYPEWLLSYWAIVSIGAVVVGVNAWWVEEELSYGLTDSAPKLIICDRERLQRLDAIRDEVPAMQVVAVRCEGDIPAYAVPWQEVLSAAPELPEAEISPDDDACIFYTSGTTGHPKGAQLTHRGCTNSIISSLFSTLSQVQALASAGGGEAPAPEKSAVLLTTPLFHVTANNVLAHANTLLGNKLVHMYKWDAGEALRLIAAEKISSLSGVPVMAREVLAHPDFDKTDTSSLKTVGGGGAAVQPDLVEKIDGLNSAQATQGYGLTEVCGLATAVFGPFLSGRPASVGPAIPIYDIKCVDDSGREMPVGERGEILLKGAQVIKGYLNRPEATAESIVDGWLHTGDIGYLDEDGFLYLVDRAKDMVLRGGENVYCAEVEAVLFKHPDINEAVVFSVPDDRLGEEVGGAVFPAPGAEVSAGQLRDFCREHLSAYKIPRYFWILEQPIPRNASGKFLKKDLQKSLPVETAG